MRRRVPTATRGRPLRSRRTSTRSANAAAAKRGTPPWTWRTAMSGNASRRRSRSVSPAKLANRAIASPSDAATPATTTPRPPVSARTSRNRSSSTARLPAHRWTPEASAPRGTRRSTTSTTTTSVSTKTTRARRSRPTGDTARSGAETLTLRRSSSSRTVPVTRKALTAPFAWLGPATRRAWTTSSPTCSGLYSWSSWAHLLRLSPSWSLTRETWMLPPASDAWP
mmetsp:Transcript_13941/g.52044  ORF Transcript_13941/g.52044 Transcript_13941/m.52044 type:complete len:225 (-) Transcript_13941:673-1347(-)